MRIIIYILLLMLPLLSQATAYKYISASDLWWGPSVAGDWDANGKPGSTDGSSTHSLTVTNGRLRTGSVLNNWTNISMNSNGKLYLTGGISNSTVTVGNTGTLELADGAVVDATTTITVQSGGTLKLGTCTLNGTIILEQGASLQLIATDDRAALNGTMTYTLNADFTFGYVSGGIDINSGGHLTFISPTTEYTVSQSSDAATDGIDVNAGGTLTLTNTSFKYNNWGDAPVIDGTIIVTDASISHEGSSVVTIGTTGLVSISNGNWNAANGTSETINGTLKVVNGNFVQSNVPTVTIGTTGHVVLYDTNAADDVGGVPNYGNYQQTGGGKTLINNGILFAETLNNGGSGTNTFQNNDVLFVKVFNSTNDNNGMANTANAIDSDFGTIDNGGSPYPGSYLFYCTALGSINQIVNSGTAFYPVGTANFPGEGTQVAYFGTSATCIDSFYSNVSSILPIKLERFEASQNGSAIELNWTTATETNNDYFTIYRSSNGKEFDEMEKINGSGNTTTTTRYTTTDNSPSLGFNYYKLQQTDLDGKSETFPVISTLYRQDSFTLLKTTSSLTLYFASEKENRIEISSLEGRILYANTFRDTEIAEIQNNFGQSVIIIKNSTNGMLTTLIIK